MNLGYLILSLTFSGVLPMKMCGQQLENDSLSINNATDRNYKFEWRQTILPASLIGAGAVALAPTFIRDGSRHVTEGVIGMRGENGRIGFDDYVQYLPVAGSLMLGCAGVKAKHTFWERTLIIGTSYATLAILTNVPKLCIDEKRPEFAGRNSFPSGHTATAFMGAELVRIEYGGWYGAGAYVVAAGVALMRVYNGRHWFHDVVAGAGVGILSARIGEWSFLLWRKAFRRSERRSGSLVLTPLVLPVGAGCYGVNVGYGF